MQIHIKLRSTTTKDFPDTSSELEGMAFDSYGFSCNALHFLGLLSDPSFADFIREVIEVNASYREEAGKKEESPTAASKRRRQEQEAAGGEYLEPLSDD